MVDSKIDFVINYKIDFAMVDSQNSDNFCQNHINSHYFVLNR